MKMRESVQEPNIPGELMERIRKVPSELSGKFNHVFTLAHEMGHRSAFWYSDHAQNYLNAGYRIFVAEVYPPVTRHC